MRKKRKGSKEKNKRDRKKEGGVKLTPFQADTVSENKSIAENRWSKYGKDEGKAKRKAEKKVILPQVQADTVVAQE